MSIINARLIASDVREVIDRTDTNMLAMIERLSIIAEEMSEQNLSLHQTNTLLIKQNELLQRRLR